MMQDSDRAGHVLAEALQDLRPALTRRAGAIIRNRSDAEDVVQETAVRAWRARSKFRAGSDPAPWLNTILTRVAVDFVRKQSRGPEPLDFNSGAPDLSAEDRFAQAEAVTAVRFAAARLASGQRRVFYLHDLVGLSSHEIAHLDKIPYNTVKTRLRRARASVRSRVQGTI